MSNNGVSLATLIEPNSIIIEGFAVPIEQQRWVPDNLETSTLNALPQFQNEEGAKEFLASQGFPIGLQDAFIASLSKLPLRFFIVDDSGSMSNNDGRKIVTTGGKKA
jgi:hypothetical protein